MGGEVALMRFGQTTLRRLLLSVARFAPFGYPPSPSSADGAAGTPGSRGYPARMATTDLDDDTKRAVRKDFDEAVNMSASALRRWLDTDESRSVGDSGGSNAESTGHEMGRHIVDLRDKHAADLDDEDYARMRKVVGYVHRHLAQRPKGDVTDTRWRYSLMNWGHDPLK
jgi:hypothetical protein